MALYQTKQKISFAPPPPPEKKTFFLFQEVMMKSLNNVLNTNLKKQKKSELLNAKNLGISCKMSFTPNKNDQFRNLNRLSMLPNI